MLFWIKGVEKYAFLVKICSTNILKSYIFFVIYNKMRLDKDKQNILEPQRLAHAKAKIEQKGYNIIYEDSNVIQFHFNGNLISFYPYSGWHTGKGIKDGRGLANLLNQI